MNTEFHGISFDLWDTAVSDSISSRERKQNRRLELLAPYGNDDSERLAALERKLPEELATHGAATRGIRIESRAKLLLAELGGPAGDAPMLAAALSETALLEAPNPAPGLMQVLDELASKFPLAIISNTRWTSGSTAREVLAQTQLATYISSLVSSDEIGWAKPSPLIFAAAWKPLGIDPAHTVHVGDSLKRDHAGATAVGAVSVISRVLRKVRELGETAAHAICWDYRDLPSLLRYLETGQLTDKWEQLAQGVPVWGTVVAGRARVIRAPDVAPSPGSVVALRNSDPDYLPLFHSAAAILAETGGNGSHAAQTAPLCDATCVVGLDGLGALLRDGDRVVVDGRRGLVWRHCESRL